MISSASTTRRRFGRASQVHWAPPDARELGKISSSGSPVIVAKWFVWWYLRPKDQLLDDFGDGQRTAAAENAFGLAALGSANEICADMWIPGFVGAPADARPRTGDGPRTVRGGAADCYPWQGCGEWLLLLAATRHERAQFTAVRPVAPLPRQD